MVHAHASRLEHFNVGEPVAEHEGGLLNGSRACFGDVVAADADGVPTRHAYCGIVHHVDKETQRGFGGEDDFILGLYFL